MVRGGEIPGTLRQFVESSHLEDCVRRDSRVGAVAKSFFEEHGVHVDERNPRITRHARR